MPDASTTRPPLRLQCMEVWGGNQVVDSGVIMPGLDAWVYSKPYGGAAGGGDVHYVSSCATGRITRLLLADVSGHGDEVAELAAQLRALMRLYVNYLDQTRFVGELNEKLAAWSADGRFATAITTTFFAPTNYLTVCNAGHPPPLIYRVRSRQWSYLEHADTAPARGDAGNVPLGVLDAVRFRQFGVKLRVGDLVLCYSDSLTESCAADGTLLGRQGMLDIVRTVSTDEPATFLSRLLDTIARTCAGNLTGDDVTALLFRPNGLAQRVPLRDRLLAPFRVARGLARSLTHKDERTRLPEPGLVNIGGSLFSSLNRLWDGRDGEDDADEA